MYIIIAGAGLIGRGLLARLMEGRHDIVVIDQNRDICESVYARFGAVTVCGNATDIFVLEDAGIKKCDAVVATMHNDADNLAFSILAHSYGVKQILVRRREPRYESAYRSAGATHITRTTSLIIDQFIVALEAPEVRKVITLAGDVDISFVSIPEAGACAGLTVQEIASKQGFPSECLIVGIYKEASDKFVVPRGSAQVDAGDRLFLSATPENTNKAAVVLTDM